MTKKILVLGATGDVGSRLVSELRRRGERVRAASRWPQQVVETGMEWIQFDLEKPESFAPALEGVDRVFLIARPGDDSPQLLALPLIAACRQAGVEHVVHLSALGVENMPEFGLRRVELALEASGLDFTHLRPNFFMQIFRGPPLLNEILSTSGFGMPAAEAAISYIDAADIAEAAAIALTEAGHRGQAYTLTGPRALRHGEIAHLLSQAAGHEIRYTALSAEQAASSLAQSGLSEARIQRLLGFYHLVRKGFCAPVSLDLAQLLGRAGRDFAEFAAAEAAHWQPRLRNDHPPFLPAQTTP